jgi:hypothetical protein
MLGLALDFPLVKYLIRPLEKRVQKLEADFGQPHPHKPSVD